MKRPFAVIGFTVMAVGALLYDKSNTTVTKVTVVLTALLLLSILIKKVRSIKIAAVSLTAAVVTSLLIIAFNSFYYLPLCSLNDEWHNVSGIICDEPSYSYSKYIYEIKLDRIDDERVNAKILLTSFTPLNCEPFDIYEGKVKLSVKGNDEEKLRQYKAKGVFLTGYSKTGEFEITPNSGFSVGKTIYKLRSFIKEKIFSCYSFKRAAIICALVLGDRDALPDNIYEAFKNAGVTHIICVSGLHLSIWSSLIIWIFKKLKLSLKAASALSIFPIVLFMLLAGMTNSVIRAGIMIIIMLFGNIISRKADSLNSLGAAITAMAVVSPFSMGSVGLQLSALSTLGLCICAQYSFFKTESNVKGIKLYIQRAFKSVLSALLTTFFAVVFTLPIMITEFEGFTLTTFISNIAVVFAAEFCMITGVIGAFLNPILPKLFNVFSLWCNISCKYIIWVTQKLSMIKGLTVKADKSDILLIISNWTLIFSLCFNKLCEGKKINKKLMIALSGIWMGAMLIIGSF